MQRFQVGGLAAKDGHQFIGRAHVFEGVEREDFDVFDVFYAGIGIFIQQTFQYLACLFAVFGKVVAFLHIFSAFATGQRWLVKGDMADQVECIKILAHLVSQGYQQYAMLFQFLQKGGLAFGLAPALQKFIE